MKNYLLLFVFSMSKLLACFHMETCIGPVVQTLPCCAGRQDMQFFDLHNVESNPFFILDLLICSYVTGII